LPVLKSDIENKILTRNKMIPANTTGTINIEVPIINKENIMALQTRDETFITME
jgi:hypothetical protein